MTKLRQLLNLKIHTLRHVAQVADRTTFMVIKYARGNSEPTATVSQAIADLFGVYHYWLWCDDKYDISDFEIEKQLVIKDMEQRKRGL